MVRHCWSLMQANDTHVTDNAFPLNRQPDYRNTRRSITRSPSKTRMQRYPQGPCITVPGRKTKPSANTYKRTSQLGRFDPFAPLLRHLSYSDARRTDPSDSALTTELWTVYPYQICTPCHSSVSCLTRQGAASCLQGWTWRLDTTR